MKYNVHVYREMRLLMQDIEAPDAQTAAKLAMEMPTPSATCIEDCEGTTLAALVDLVGDDEFAQSEFFDAPFLADVPAVPPRLRLLSRWLPSFRNNA